MGYQPIENYGLIGDTHSAALVGQDGSIDWLCYPRFDSPSIFGAILDDRKGGSFRIAPSCPHATRRQLYWPDTNVLATRILSDSGVAEITDFMPMGSRGIPGAPFLVRKVHSVRGEAPFRIHCRPAFDYARARHETRIDGGSAIFKGPEFALELRGTVDFRPDGEGVAAEFTLKPGETAAFALGPPSGRSFTADDAEGLFRATVDYWHRWLSRCTYVGRWREIVQRSALTLKLLTYEPTGAIIAAPTCSLPERIGGTRNWDYRCTWIRDSAFTLYGLMRIGFTEEAGAFMRWIEERSHEPHQDAPLQVVYRIDGNHDLEEATLDHLDGYRGSKPARIGNGAANQFQLDVYGELMDAVYLYNKYGAPISFDLWTELVRITDFVCDNWRREDEGIWEVRGGARQFVYSKLMCWVAIDRALRLAFKRSFPADRARWSSVRDEIYLDVMRHGWNERRGAFAQSYGDDALDASVLIMPLVFFLSPTDPRLLKTLDTLRRPIERGGLSYDSLVYRYDPSRSPDGLEGHEGAFNMCSFWMVEALTRAGKADVKYLREARVMFEHMLGNANHLGLYAEETGGFGEALGNYPQGFTHLALISAAFNLDRALGPG